MNESLALQRRYRRLLIAFPADHRREYGEEMIGVLLASTPEGRRRPRLADALDLITGGLRTRLRPVSAGRSDTAWPDALAVGSVALPLMVFAALASIFLYSIVRFGWDPGLGDFYLPSLALAVPALIALRFKRTAAVIALVAAAWYWFLLLRILTVWIDGLFAGYCAALLVQAIALAGSPGPRRAGAIMTWKTCLVVCAAGITMGLVSLWYIWALPWQATALVFTFLAVLGAGLMLTLPKPVALRLPLILAIPAAPGAVWVLQFAHVLPYAADQLPLLAGAAALLVCVAVWRVRRGGKTA